MFGGSFFSGRPMKAPILGTCKTFPDYHGGKKEIKGLIVEGKGPRNLKNLLQIQWGNFVVALEVVEKALAYCHRFGLWVD